MGQNKRGLDEIHSVGAVGADDNSTVGRPAHVGSPDILVRSSAGGVAKDIPKAEAGHDGLAEVDGWGAIASWLVSTCPPLTLECCSFVWTSQPVLRISGDRAEYGPGSLLGSLRTLILRP